MSEGLVELVARYMAAEDWLEDPTKTIWWYRKSKEFRAQYHQSATRLIEMVREWDSREHTG